MSEWFVYVLRCADGSLYTGVTTDVVRRVEEHNENDRLAAKYTRARRPVALVYSESAESRAEACSRENGIKAMKKDAKERLVHANACIENTMF